MQKWHSEPGNFRFVLKNKYRLLAWASVCSPTRPFAVEFFHSTKISLGEMHDINKIPDYSIIYDGEH